MSGFARDFFVSKVMAMQPMAISAGLVLRCYNGTEDSFVIKLESLAGSGKPKEWSVVLTGAQVLDPEKRAFALKAIDDVIKRERQVSTTE